MACRSSGQVQLVVVPGELAALHRQHPRCVSQPRVACGLDGGQDAQHLRAEPCANPQSSGWDTLVNFDHFIPVIGALRELGLADRMGFGSDAGPFDTEFGHMEYSVEIARLAGLSLMESLQVVTRNAACLCGLDDTVGTVDTGKAADLLVLDGNPLYDVGNLTRVVAVLMGGERVV